MISARVLKHGGRWLKRGVLVLLAAGSAGVIGFMILFHAVPFPIGRLEAWPGSPQVTDRTGRVLLSVVGEDEQWRYPVAQEDISPWLVQATIAVEDQRFHDHCGVDGWAVLRAAAQNLAEGRVVSGASTLTMQVCRMMDNRPRTWIAKAVEAFRAVQLERIRDKDEILTLYLNVAPYGGNVRGVEAASRRYFNKTAAELSLGEAVLLAGLPQAPSRYRPDRHPAAALIRRETVLRRMAESGFITDRQNARVIEEPVNVARPVRCTAARHAAWLALQRCPSGGRTTIDLQSQRAVVRLVAEHRPSLPPRTQVAAVVIEIATGNMVALVGSSDFDAPVDGQVNGVLARRSPGSALKPFVYAAAFEARRLGPPSTVYDVPIHRAGWSPQNFGRTFVGEVTAAEALRDSLNIPAIGVAEGVGLARCVGLVQAVGVVLPENSVARAGLSVVVGATEVTLLDLTNAYATLGRGGVRRPPRLLMDEASEAVTVLEANTCAAIDEILSSRERRPAGLEGLATPDIPWFMWKTGTSSRRRDAWAVGHNRRFAIGVWAGRFSGAGHARLVGAQAAAPLLARLFAHPRFRSAEAPPASKPWPVQRPLRRPAEIDLPLHVFSPSDGAVFIAVAGRATVHPRVNRGTGVTWFLNGKHLPDREAQRLTVRPGAHEVRCVDSTGASSAVSFTVRTADAE